MAQLISAIISILVIIVVTGIFILLSGFLGFNVTIILMLSILIINIGGKSK